MKGIVFNVFTELVDQMWGEAMTETIIEKAHLPSGGAYSGVGTYCFQEMVALVTVLSAETSLSPSDLQKAFGAFLYGKLAEKYPLFKAEDDTLFSFLEKIEDTIHVQVKKLYPEAELPSFRYHKPDADTLELTYQSKRPFADLCEGLIQGAIKSFGDRIDMERTDYSVETGSKALFRLRRLGA